MTYKMTDGYFTEVNGHPVKRETANMPHTTWKPRPVGIVWHYTAGCNDDIIGTLESNDFGGAQFCVGRDGTIREYAPVATATWHAREASNHYWGIEHTALPGSCMVTDVQLAASAKLSAALVEFAQDHFDVSIPLVKLAPPVLMGQLGERRGFLDHTDGLNLLETSAEQSWNDAGHTDRLIGWSWDKYLAAVKAAGAGTSEEDQMIDEYIDGQNAAQAKVKASGGKDPGEPNPDKPKHWRAGWADVRWQVLNLVGRDGKDGAKGDPGEPGVMTPHSHPFHGATEMAP